MTIKIEHLIIFGLLQFNLPAMASGAGVTYHGRLLGPDGSPVSAGSVQFRLQIKTPGNENCLMYEEIQNKDLSNSNGIFAVTINDGSGARQDANSFSIDQIFANRGGFSFPGGYCATGSSYSPNSSDGRKLQVYFNDGTFSGWEPVPAQDINFVPLAIESMQVGGYKKENLVKVATGVDTTGSDLSSANFTELLALLNGTSAQYIRPGAANFTAAPQWSGTPSGANDLVNKSYVDAQIAAGLPNFGTAGTYTKVTTDSKGRVSSGTTLVATDIPALDANKITTGILPIANGGTNSGAALTGSKVMVSSGSSIIEGVASTTAKSNNTFVLRDGTGSFAAALGTFDSLSILAGGNLMLNASLSGNVGLVAPTSVTNYTMTLPATSGNANQVLTTDGTGILSWTTPSSGLPAVAGSAPAPGYAFSGNINTGLFNPAINQIGFSTNGLERVRIDANGNIGIGTTAPSSPLEVSAYNTNTAGSIYGARFFSDNYSGLSSLSTNNTGIYGEANNSGSSFSSTGKFIGVNGTSAVVGKTIASTIGTQGLSYQNGALSQITDARGVYGNVMTMHTNSNLITNAYGGYFEVNGAGANSVTNGYGIYTGNISGTTNKWSLFASDATAPSYFAGSVGIGTTSPAATLQVIGNAIFGTNTGSPTATPLNVSFGGTYGTNPPGSSGNLKWSLYSDGTSANQYGIGMSAGLMEFRAGAGSDLAFFPNNGIQALRITSSGNVGIGTASPQASLDVNGTLHLAKNSSAPSACDATHDGNMALTHIYTTCVCNGGSTTWVKTSDGSTACTW